MVPALILVFAVWCPIPPTTTTTSAPASTTSTSSSTTTTTAPRLIVLPPDPFPSMTTTTTTTTVAPVVVDAARISRPQPQRRLPVTGPDGQVLVAAGLLVMLGGLFLAAGHSPKERP